MEICRKLSSFPLPSKIRFKLCTAGYSTTEDLKDTSPCSISKDTGLSIEEATELLKLVFPNEKENNFINAESLLEKKKLLPSIITCCRSLDNALGGGIPLKKVTEICGVPGIGKTQFCLQLCINVQIPSRCNGVGGESIFIDAGGGFLLERLTGIASASVEYYSRAVFRKTVPKVFPCGLDDYSVKSLLQGIHYFHCSDCLELIAVINLLPKLLKIHAKVKLIVIDSIAFHFRHGFENDYGNRTRLLTNISQMLIKIASTYSVAVLLTNQMTTKFISENSCSVVPSLGVTWSHGPSIRILLHWENNQRCATLHKSANLEQRSVYFDIKECGIIDSADHHI